MTMCYRPYLPTPVARCVTGVYTVCCGVLQTCYKYTVYRGVLQVCHTMHRGVLQVYRGVLQVCNTVLRGVFQVCNTVFRGVFQVCNTMYRGVLQVYRGVLQVCNTVLRGVFQVCNTVFRGVFQVCNTMYRGVFQVCNTVCRGVFQVCNTVYPRLQLTTSQCVCPRRSPSPCSRSLLSTDGHSVSLVTDPKKGVSTRDGSLSGSIRQRQLLSAHSDFYLSVSTTALL